MPAYLIVHPRDQRRDDVLIEDPALTLRFEAGWAILADARGDCLAIPSGQGAHIQRVDEQQDTTNQEPAPRKE
ncbi:hypothetical protein [Streptomyces acidicola]|uniref:Uncharacterized protein n=1 Tax=Streptomyces acidicola TaxID=2596892 RepID=A0A5N8WI55_9ACTN|nr:hypothetical protein [Streptomyces acidicola]MPY47150.1 hypothetical protein [Streptomyces acidicola]MPY47289.1 hypothetical protein [Streptomyces acidicola]